MGQPIQLGPLGGSPRKSDPKEAGAKWSRTEKVARPLTSVLRELSIVTESGPGTVFIKGGVRDLAVVTLVTSTNRREALCVLG